jgi:hypothetical protein
VNRPRDSKGRFLKMSTARAAKNADLALALPALAAAIKAESPTPNRLIEVSIWSIEIRFLERFKGRLIESGHTWARVARVLEDADLTNVPKLSRVRYLIAARNENGDVRPLSRAYTSAELALGEAIATLDGETVLSPKEGDDDIASALWTAIVCNCYLRKDANR